MPAKKQPRTLVTCPHCGNRQLEPRLAYSTICKKCREHFRLRETAAPNLEMLPSPGEEPSQDLRNVTCFNCGTELDVPASAQSTMCKRCSSHVDLRDYTINTTVSKNFKTKGRFVVEESGYLLNTDTIAGEAVIKGRVIGRLRAEGTLELYPKAEIKGSFTAGCLVIPSGTRLRWPEPIVAGGIDLSGELVANVQVDGTVTLRSHSRFFGDVEARNLVVESGAVFVGLAKIGSSTAKTTALPASSPVKK